MRCRPVSIAGIRRPPSPRPAVGRPVRHTVSRGTVRAVVSPVFPPRGGAEKPRKGRGQRSRPAARSGVLRRSARYEQMFDCARAYNGGLRVEAPPRKGLRDCLSTSSRSAARASTTSRLRPRHPARQARRDHRPVRLGQELARVRHHLRRGPAPLRRVALGLRAPVPRPDAEARRRPHRGPVARRSRSTRRRRRSNPRSTVGTVTEIYDYLRLLYARVGIPHCPICGRGHRAADARADRRPHPRAAGGHEVQRARAGREGPQGRVRQAARRPQAGGLHARARRRARCAGSTRRSSLDKKYKHDIDVVVDRLVMKDGHRRRAWPTRVEMALQARGRARCSSRPRAATSSPSRRRSPARCTASRWTSSQPRDFSFNGPYGACPDCTGLGSRLEPDPDLIVPDDSLSLARGRDQAVLGRHELLPAARRGGREALRRRRGRAVEATCPRRCATRCSTGSATSASASTTSRATGARRTGTRATRARSTRVMRRYEETESEGSKEKLEEYMAVIPCTTCGGARLKPEILAVTFGGRNIHEVTTLSAKDSLEFFDERRALRARRADRPARHQGDRRAAALPRRRRARLPDARARRRRRSPAARRSASGSPRRSAPGSWACSTSSTSRRSACTSATTRGSSRRWSACATSATPSSSSSTTRRPSAPPTSSSTWARARASTAARSSARARPRR